jgi:hypothetical protein
VGTALEALPSLPGVHLAAVARENPVTLENGSSRRLR